MGLEAQIWARKLRGGGYEEEGGEEEGDDPICVKAYVIDPFGAAALLPLIFTRNLLKQGTGTADNLTLLRLLIYISTCR